MNEANVFVSLSHLMADKNWDYIWPCYVLAVVTFTALGARAALKLQQWEQRAKDLEKR